MGGSVKSFVSRINGCKAAAGDYWRDFVPAVGAAVSRAPRRAEDVKLSFLKALCARPVPLLGRVHSRLIDLSKVEFFGSDRLQPIFFGLSVPVFDLIHFLAKNAHLFLERRYFLRTGEHLDAGPRELISCFGEFGRESLRLFRFAKQRSDKG